MYLCALKAFMYKRVEVAAWLAGPLPRLNVYSCWVDVVIRSLYLTRFAQLVRRACHPHISISNDPSIVE